MINKMRTNQKFKESNSLTENLKKISLSLLSGIIAGVYVNESVNVLGGFAYFGIMVPFLLIMLLTFELLPEPNTLADDRLKEQILELLKKEELDFAVLASKLEYSPDEIYYNLQELQDLGKVVVSPENGKKYTRTDKISTENEEDVVIERFIYPPYSDPIEEWSES